MPGYTRRVDYVDVGHQSASLANAQGSLLETLALMARDPGRLEQTRRLSLMLDHRCIAMRKYALGYPMAEVREDLVQAVRACLKVFQLRGTEAPFPLHIATVWVNEQGRPQGTIRPAHPEGAKDFSYTNSRTGYWYTCLAFGVGEDAAGRQLASMIWDPPEAAYVGSEVCTRNDQALAYCLRDWLAGELSAAQQWVSKIRARPSDPAAIQAITMRSLIVGDGQAFLSSLHRLLSEHDTQARKWHNRRLPEYLICVPAMGLCALALGQGVISVDGLPKADQYLPLDWLTHADK